MTTAIALTGNIVPSEVFKPFQVQIDEFKEINEKTVFNYDDPKGNKEARSHVAKLRKVKTPIKTAHKDAKAEALKLGRALDEYKNNLIDQVDEMINIHAEPLKRIEDAEKERIAEKERLAQLELDHAEALEMHDLFKREEAMRIQQEKLEAEKKRLAEIEAEQKRKQEQLEREEQIKKEAEEKAKRETELKLQQEKNKRLEEKKNARVKRIVSLGLIFDGKQYIKNDLNIHLTELLSPDDVFESVITNVTNEIKRRDEEEAKKKADKEKQDAIDKLKREQEEKERLEQERIAKEKFLQEQKDAAAKRKAENIRHQKSVNKKIINKLVSLGLSDDLAQVVTLEASVGNIPGLSVNY